MATRKLERTDWRRYFDHLSKELGPRRVDVLIEGLDIGVQVETDKVPLTGISFDPADDSISVQTESLEHRIPHPQAVWLKEDDAGRLLSFQVVDGDGHTQIVELAAALLLRSA